jgi:hypothetical protein
MSKDTKCFICNANTKYFFSKSYKSYSGSPFPEPLIVDYYKCTECGFVLSNTHREMSIDAWSKLNESWHHLFESTKDLAHINQPPYADQGLALKILSQNGMINISNAIDYAAGYGTLGKFLSKYFGIQIDSYDRYVHDPENLSHYVNLPAKASYDLVINSAMFEHITSRAALDEVNDLVSDAGVLVIHTQICENVPQDPNWFYLEPVVHSAFHTNKSMEVLMKQWGYSHSIYALEARIWFLFKNNYPYLDSLECKVEEINSELQTQYLFFKKGFVDYWKGY